MLSERGGEYLRVLFLFPTTLLEAVFEPYLYLNCRFSELVRQVLFLPPFSQVMTMLESFLFVF